MLIESGEFAFRALAGIGEMAQIDRTAAMLALDLIAGGGALQLYTPVSRDTSRSVV